MHRFLFATLITAGLCFAQEPVPESQSQTTVTHVKSDGKKVTTDTTTATTNTDAAGNKTTDVTNRSTVTKSKKHGRKRQTHTTVSHSSSTTPAQP